MKKYFILIFVLFLLTSCGDESGSDDLDLIATSLHIPVKKAYFIDSAVSGVSYSDGQFSGLTGSNGVFTYASDSSSITLSLGGITLGNIAPSSINSDTYVLVSDILGLSRTNTSNTNLTNILQLLQSLDSDNYAMNGISIDSNTISTLSARGDNLATSTQSDLTTLVGLVGKSLTPLNTAIANYEETLHTLIGSSVDTVPPAPVEIITDIANLVTKDDSITIVIRGEVGSTLYVDNVAQSGVIGSSREKSVTLNTSGADGAMSFVLNLDDGVQATKSDNYTISITKDSTPPVFTSASTDSFDEDFTITNAFYVATATDATTLTYSLSGTDASNFTINSSSGELFIDAQPDYESTTSYSLNIIATDAAGNATTQALAITVVDVNDVAPVFTTTSISNIDEGVTAITTITFSDEDTTNGTTVFSLSGNDAASFTIDSSTGLIAFNSAPDYESKNSYLVTVSISDGVNSTSKSYTIGINNLDDTAPVITTSALTHDEGVGSTSIATIAYTDSDGATFSTYTYSITGGVDSAKFSINSSTGLLSFVVGADFENPTDSDSNNVYVVDVKIVDSGAQSDSATISVTINDTNDTDIAFSTGANISATAGTSSVTIAATDDAVSTITYEIISEANTNYADFNINSSTGVLSLKAGTFQSSDSDRSVKIKVYSSSTDYALRTFTITVP